MIKLAAGADIAAIIDGALSVSRLSQADLARATGYAEGQISKWRRGLTVPSGPVLLRLFAGLGYDLALVPREDA